MVTEFSWKKELKFAESYAIDGPAEWPEDTINRCLENAIKKAKKEGVDVSAEVKRIRKIWASH